MDNELDKSVYTDDNPAMTTNLLRNNSKDFAHVNGGKKRPPMDSDKDLESQEAVAMNEEDRSNDPRNKNVWNANTWKDNTLPVGPDLFTKFPLMEFRSRRKKVSDCKAFLLPILVLYWSLVLFTAYFWMTSQKTVGHLRLDQVSNITISTTGCDVIFHHPKMAQSWNFLGLGKAFTQDSCEFLIASQEHLSPCISWIYNGKFDLSNLFTDQTYRNSSESDGSGVVARNTSTGVVVKAFERLNSFTPCKVNIWAADPLKTVTIISTIRHIDVKKIDSESINQYATTSPVNWKSTHWNFTEIGNWKMSLDALNIQGSSVSVKLNNIFLKSSLNVQLEKGHVSIHGLEFMPDSNIEVNNTVRVGVDLGDVMGVGKFRAVNTSRCGTTKYCGGSVHVSLVSPTYVRYQQKEGKVCAVAKNALKQYSDCQIGANQSMPSLNASSNVSSTCKGEVLLCNGNECREGENYHKLNIMAEGGGVYVSVLNYSLGEYNMVNNRKTIDDQKCIFPFPYKGRLHFECTLEDYDRPWCTTSYAAIRDPSKLNAMPLDPISQCAENGTNSSDQCNAEDSMSHWGVCAPLQAVKGYAYSRTGRFAVQFDEESKTALRQILAFERKRLNDPILAPLEMLSKSAAKGRSLWLYATNPVHLLIRNDVLAINSGGLVSARYFVQGSSHYGLSPRLIRQSPGFCPTESLPDGTLSSQQMGLVSAAVRKEIGESAPGVIAWFGNYEQDLALKAKNRNITSNSSFVSSDFSVGFYEEMMSYGTVLFSPMSDGSVSVEGIGNHDLAAVARWTLFFSISLGALTFCCCGCRAIHLPKKIITKKYKEMIKKKRKLSLTERQIHLERRSAKLGLEREENGFFWDDKELWKKYNDEKKTRRAKKRKKDNEKQRRQTNINLHENSYCMNVPFFMDSEKIEFIDCAIMSLNNVLDIELRKANVGEEIATAVHGNKAKCMSGCSKQALKNNCSAMLRPFFSLLRKLSSIVYSTEDTSDIECLRNKFTTLQNSDSFALSVKNIEDLEKKLIKIESAWLEYKKNQIGNIDKLSFWEVPLIFYEFRIRPSKAGGLEVFLRNHLLYEKKVLAQWWSGLKTNQWLWILTKFKIKSCMNLKMQYVRETAKIKISDGNNDHSEPAGKFEESFRKLSNSKGISLANLQARYDEYRFDRQLKKKHVNVNAIEKMLSRECFDINYNREERRLTEVVFLNKPVTGIDYLYESLIWLGLVASQEFLILFLLLPGAAIILFHHHQAKFFTASPMFQYEDLRYRPYTIARVYEMEPLFVPIVLGLLYFVLANLDLFIYYVSSSLLEKPNSDKYFKTKDTVRQRERPTKSSSGTMRKLQNIAKTSCCFCCDSRSLHEYEIYRKNILRDGTVDSYICIKKDDEGNVEVTSMTKDSITRVPTTKDKCKSVLYAIARRVCRIIHFLFRLSIYLLLSFYLAYATTVLIWWILGAIINPERMLAFASAGMVFVGTFYKLVSDFMAMKHEAKLQIKVHVSEMFERIIRRSKNEIGSSVAAATSNVKLPALPGVFSALTKKKSPLEIYNKLKTEDGIKELVNDVLNLKFQDLLNGIVYRIVDNSIEKISKDLESKPGRGQDDIETDKMVKRVLLLENKIFEVLKSESPTSTLANLCKSHVPKSIHPNLYVLDELSKKAHKFEFALLILKEFVKCLMHPKPELATSFRSFLGKTLEKMVEKYCCKEEDKVPKPDKAPVRLVCYTVGLLASRDNFYAHVWLNKLEAEALTIVSENNADPNTKEYVKLIFWVAGVLFEDEKIFLTFVHHILDIFSFVTKTKSNDTVKGNKRSKSADKKTLPCTLLMKNIYLVKVLYIPQILKQWNSIRTEEDVEGLVKILKDVQNDVIRMIPIALNGGTQFFQSGTWKIGLSRITNSFFPNPNPKNEISLTKSESDENNMKGFKTLVNLFGRVIQLLFSVPAVKMNNKDFQKIIENEKKILRKIDSKEDTTVLSLEKKHSDEKNTVTDTDIVSVFHNFLDEIILKNIKVLPHRHMPDVLESLTRWLAGQMIVNEKTGDHEDVLHKNIKKVETFYSHFHAILSSSDSPAQTLQHGKKIVIDFVELYLPNELDKALTFIRDGERIRNTAMKLKLKAMQAMRDVSPSDKYDAMFYEVDTSGDGKIDYAEYKMLCNDTLSLNLSEHKMRQLFANSDVSNEGNLNINEFRGAMDKLQAEMSKSVLSRLGLGRQDLLSSVLYVVVSLGCILTFILFGFHAFTGGSAIAAGIGALLPLVTGFTGKAMGLPQTFKRADLRKLIDRVMKEDFQESN
jgi:hypothetical protein